MNLPKISVVTITYGHEKYIRETLDGVLIQQYPGPIEFIIANDNSPDKTDEVVKTYFQEHPAPENFEIKYTRHPENKGMMPNFIWALEQATGKYIALCEGDDYWTDPLKLRQQVDFLEENEDFVACGTYAQVLRRNILEIPAEKIVFQEFLFLDLLNEKWIPTLTVMLRKNSLENTFAPILDDVSLLLNISVAGGKLAVLPFVSAVYRYHGAGMVSGASMRSQYQRYYNVLYTFATFYQNQHFNDAVLKKIKRNFISDLRGFARLNVQFSVLVVSIRYYFKILNKM